MVAPAITNPTAIAVDDNNVYWADDLMGHAGTSGPMPRTDPSGGTVRKATK